MQLSGVSEQATPPTPAALPESSSISSAPDSPWSRLLQSIAGRPALAWINALQFHAMDSSTLTVTHVPGQRDMLKFIDARRREQLAALLQPILQRSIKVEVFSPQPTLTPSAPPTSPPVTSSPTSSAAPSPLTRPVPSPPAPPAGTSPGKRPVLDEQALLQLPLVQLIMSEFEVSVDSIRPLEPPKPDPLTDDQEPVTGSSDPALFAMEKLPEIFTNDVMPANPDQPTLDMENDNDV